MRVYVTPRPGLSPRDPHTFQILPPRGDWKHNKRAWARMARSGDVAVTDKPMSASEFKKAFGVSPPVAAAETQTDAPAKAANKEA